jgi:ribulose-phosphate 3-epimerase
MTLICPTVTAFGVHDYRSQIETLETFSERLHIDLMDGVFAPTKSPEISQLWLPDKLTSDIHLMYQKPADVIDSLIKLKPNLIIVHFEAELDYESLPVSLQLSGIKAGLAVLSETPIEECLEVIKYFDHVLIFSGKLGYHGGSADMALLEKIRLIRHAYPGVEIGWDGGVNNENVASLAEGGVDVLNVGGYIHSSKTPAKNYQLLNSLLPTQH